MEVSSFKCEIGVDPLSVAMLIGERLGISSASVGPSSAADATGEKGLQQLGLLGEEEETLRLQNAAVSPSWKSAGVEKNSEDRRKRRRKNSIVELQEGEDYPNVPAFSAFQKEQYLKHLNLLTQKTAKFCENHNTSEKRMKGICKQLPCRACNCILQTNYVDFFFCPQCSNAGDKCMICGEEVLVGLDTVGGEVCTNENYGEHFYRPDKIENSNASIVKPSFGNETETEKPSSTKFEKNPSSSFTDSSTRSATLSQGFNTASGRTRQSADGIGWTNSEVSVSPYESDSPFKRSLTSASVKSNATYSESLEDVEDVQNSLFVRKSTSLQSGGHGNTCFKPGDVSKAKIGSSRNKPRAPRSLSGQIISTNCNY